MTFKSTSVLFVALAVVMTVCPFAPAQTVKFEVEPFPTVPPETSVGRVSNLDQNDLGAIDKFAWKTFIALNWPALDPAKNKNVRGVPDLKQDILTAAPDTLTVWETMKEKREIFNPVLATQKYRVLPARPEAAIANAWNSPVDYGLTRSADEEKPPVSAPAPTGRVLHAITKMSSHYNGLDETIEVLSQDLNPAEAKSPDGTPYKMAVAPRVWVGPPANESPVLYEVKLNYDFFRYVAKYGLTNDEQAAALAKTSAIRLPFRTTASSEGTKNQERVQNYTAKRTLAAYQKANAAPDPSVGPPRVGAIQLKAAWIRLNDKPLAQLTPAERKAVSNYHLTTADYYVSDAGKATTKSGTFGLVGLHIIQRVHFDIEDKARPAGGSFVFATWEHIDNDTPGKYTFCNFFDMEKNKVTKPKTGWYPHAPGKLDTPVGIPVVRRPDAVLPMTKKVNDVVHSWFGNSVWKNYKLIGTQFLPIDLNDVYDEAPDDVFPYPPIDPGPTPEARVKVYDPTGIGQNAFLANLVLETNGGLQNFQGIPPGIGGPTGEFIAAKPREAGIKGNPLGEFIRSPVPKADRAKKSPYNTVFNASPKNMGGCMGCHGVAQIQGYSFSFVLLGGSAGAKTDTQTNFDLPLSNANQPKEPAATKKPEN